MRVIATSAQVADLAKDLAGAPARAKRSAARVTRSAARSGAATARSFARESAGSHGKHYPRSISHEMTGVTEAEFEEHFHRLLLRELAPRGLNRLDGAFESRFGHLELIERFDRAHSFSLQHLSIGNRGGYACNASRLADFVYRPLLDRTSSHPRSALGLDCQEPATQANKQIGHAFRLHG
mgnify:CR=1 FL=1